MSDTETLTIEILSKYDKDKKGGLNITEMLTFFDDYHISVTELDIYKARREIGLLKRENVTLFDFNKIIRSKTIDKIVKKELKLIFKTLDANSDNLLTMSDMESISKLYDIDPKILSKIREELKETKRINFQGFVHIMSSL